MEIKRIKTTKYCLWNNDINEISNKEFSNLDDYALKEINKMEKEGYTSGQLYFTVNVDDKEIEIEGSWDISISTV